MLTSFMQGRLLSIDLDLFYLATMKANCLIAVYPEDSEFKVLSKGLGGLGSEDKCLYQRV